jgi:hypothetical protein
MLTSGEFLRFSTLVLWENFGGNRILQQRKERKKTKETKNFDEKHTEIRSAHCRRGGFPCPPDQAKPEN